MKEAVKSDGTAKSKETSSGWSLFGRGKKKVKVANLGEESNMYYNQELKRWVERGKEAEAAAEAAADAAPPKQVAHVPSAPSGGRKALTQRYVLQNNLSVSSSASSSFADLAGQHGLSAAPASFLAPPPASTDGAITPRQFFVPLSTRNSGQSDANVTDTNTPKFFIPGSNNGNSKRQSGSIYGSYSRSKRSSIEIESRLSDPGSSDKVQDRQAESSAFAAPAAQEPATAAEFPLQHEPQSSYHDRGPETEVNVTASEEASHSKQSQLTTHAPGDQQAQQGGNQSSSAPVFQFKAGLVDALKTKIAENLKRQNLSKRDSFDFDRVMHPGVPHKLDGPLPWELPDPLKHSDQFISICTNWQKNNPGVAYSHELLLASITEIPPLPSASASTGLITPSTLTPRDHATTVISPTGSQSSVNQPEPTNNGQSSYQQLQQPAPVTKQPMHTTSLGVIQSDDGLSGHSCYSLPMPPASSDAQVHGKQQIPNGYDEVEGGVDLTQSDMHDPEAMNAAHDHKLEEAHGPDMPANDVEGLADTIDPEGSTVGVTQTHPTFPEDDDHQLQLQGGENVDETTTTTVCVQSEMTVTLDGGEAGAQQPSSDAGYQQQTAAEEQAYWAQWYEYVQQQLQQNPEYINTDEYAQWYMGYNAYLERHAQQQQQCDEGAAVTLVTTTETTSVMVVEETQDDNNSNMHSHEHHDTSTVRTVVENAVTAVLMAAEPTASSDHDADTTSLSAELSLRIDSKRFRTADRSSFESAHAGQDLTQHDSLVLSPTIVHQVSDAAVADLVSDAMHMHQVDAAFELQPFLHANGIANGIHDEQHASLPAKQHADYANGNDGQYAVQNGVHHDSAASHASEQHSTQANGNRDFYSNTPDEVYSTQGKAEQPPEKSLTEAAGCIEQLLQNLKAGLPVSPAALQGVANLMQLLSDPALAAHCHPAMHKPQPQHAHGGEVLDKLHNRDEQPEAVHGLHSANTAKYVHVNGYTADGSKHKSEVHTEVNAVIQQVCGQYQQRISELEAEVVQHKTAYEETKADLDELMLCLGQETAKVAELCNAMQSLGVDPQQVVGPIEEAYAMQGLAADDSATPEYSHVDDTPGYHTHSYVEQAQVETAQHYDSNVQYGDMTDARHELVSVEQQHAYQHLEDGGFENAPTFSQQQVQGYSTGSARTSFESVSRSPMLCV